MSAPKPPSGQRGTTTFLTLDEGNRAPSAYKVDIAHNSVGQSQRARQEHPHGPAVTRKHNAVHGFTADKKGAKTLTNLMKTSIARGLDPQTALRMEILDGHASPRAKAGNGHVEAFDTAPGRGNPHRSGGTVMFASSRGPLSDFAAVAENVNAGGEPIHDRATTRVTRAGAEFNRAASHDQQSWARRLLGNLFS